MFPYRQRPSSSLIAFYSLVFKSFLLSSILLRRRSTRRLIPLVHKPIILPSPLIAISLSRRLHLISRRFLRPPPITSIPVTRSSRLTALISACVVSTVVRVALIILIMASVHTLWWVCVLSVVVGIILCLSMAEWRSPGPARAVVWLKISAAATMG